MPLHDPIQASSALPPAGPGPARQSAAASRPGAVGRPMPHHRRSQRCARGGRLARWQRLLALVLAPLVWLVPQRSVAAAEPAGTMVSRTEAARTVPAGPWQGTWLLRLDHPRLRTLAAQRALTLTIFHDAGSPRADVDWLADRAICQPPTGPACEWVGQTGSATAVAVTPLGLYAVLRVSADDADPWFLHLAPPAAGGAASATLLSARGDLRLRLSLQRQP